MSNSIYMNVYDMVSNEKTKIGARAFDVLNREGIADIICCNDVFWFEHYQIGNDCPNAVYDYLIRFIKRNFCVKYIGELNTH